MTSRRRAYVSAIVRTCASKASPSLAYSWKTYCANVPLCRSAPCFASTIFSRISSSPNDEPRDPHAGRHDLASGAGVDDRRASTSCETSGGRSLPSKRSSPYGSSSTIGRPKCSQMRTTLSRRRRESVRPVGILKVRHEVEKLRERDPRARARARATREAGRLRRCRRSDSGLDRRRRLESRRGTTDLRARRDRPDRERSFRPSRGPAATR